MTLHHALPLALAATAAGTRSDQRAGETFARRRIRQRRPILIATAAVALAAVVVVFGACEQTTPVSKPVYASKVITVRAADFTAADVPGATASVAIAEHSVSEITAEAIADGMVSAYLTGSSDSGNWVPLPFTASVTLGALDVTVTLSYRFSVGKAALTVIANLRASQMEALIRAGFEGNRVRITVGEG